MARPRRPRHRSAPKPRRATPISRISARTAPSWSGRTARRRGGRAWRGPDPGAAVATAMRRCEETNKQGCALYAVNNYTVAGRDWRQLVPARAADAPDIGRLRPEPYWSMRGPQRAAGLIVWSHGYMAGRNATEVAPQTLDRPLHGARLRPLSFRSRMDQRLAGRCHCACRRGAPRPRQIGYRRVLLAGQSAGAWVSLAALHARRAGRRRDLDLRRPPWRGDEHAAILTRARSEWQQWSRR